MWYTFPIFEFKLNESSYLAKHHIHNRQAQTSKDEFLSFVEESLNRRILHQFSIHEFRMSIYFRNLEHLTPWMDRWLAIIIGRNVKKLDLDICCRGPNGLYKVPPIVLGAKSITVLRLSTCDLNLTLASGIIKFSQLRELCLTEMHIDQWMIQTFTSSCPLIEFLELRRCIGLDCLCLPSSLLQLNRVVLSDCFRLKIVQIEVPNLVDLFVWDIYDITFPKINIVACGKSLRKLSLLILRTMTE
ncbi:hypothetical protein Vadar_011844 [Vaccinium darrowii]|uniref:Uncharacterized protein n=1 Tax=Vaccinium darrowii TaxID=229202 RepID=A0ACB7YKY2_9ERIC|nr:hypothetical protein Vadar_011844 [Vaccinium darrowii]